jgi:hypothetical protein
VRVSSFFFFETFPKRHHHSFVHFFELNVFRLEVFKKFGSEIVSGVERWRKLGEETCVEVEILGVRDESPTGTITEEFPKSFKV